MYAHIFSLSLYPHPPPAESLRPHKNLRTTDSRIDATADRIEAGIQQHTVVVEAEHSVIVAHTDNVTNTHLCVGDDLFGGLVVYQKEIRPKRPAVVVIAQ
jgi:hypothetical protein